MARPKWWSSTRSRAGRKANRFAGPKKDPLPHGAPQALACGASSDADHRKRDTSRYGGHQSVNRRFRRQDAFLILRLSPIAWREEVQAWPGAFQYALPAAVTPISNLLSANLRTAIRSYWWEASWAEEPDPIPRSSLPVRNPKGRVPSLAGLECCPGVHCRGRPVERASHGVHAVAVPACRACPDSAVVPCG